MHPRLSCTVPHCGCCLGTVSEVEDPLSFQAGHLWKEKLRIGVGQSRESLGQAGCSIYIYIYTAPALVGGELGKHLSDFTLVPSPPLQGKYSKRKGRFKRSDGSTSSDTTSNSFVRQVTGKEGLGDAAGWWRGGGWLATFSRHLFSRHLSPTWSHHTRHPVTSLHPLLPPLLQHQLPAPAACLPLLPASSHSGTAWPASSWLASGCHPLPLPAVCFHVLPQNL